MICAKTNPSFITFGVKWNYDNLIFFLLVYDNLTYIYKTSGWLFHRSQVSHSHFFRFMNNILNKQKHKIGIHPSVLSTRKINSKQDMTLYLTTSSRSLATHLPQSKGKYKYKYSE